MNAGLAQRYGFSGLFGSRVARRLLLWTVVVGLLASLAISLWEFMVDYDRRLQVLQRNIDSIGEVSSPALIQSIWALDSAQIELQLKGFARMPDVSVVQLNLKEGDDYRFGPAELSEETLHQRFKLIHYESDREHYLGTLTLTKDLVEERRVVQDRLLASIFGNALVVLLAALTVTGVYQAIVTRRLLAIAQQLRAISAEDLRSTPDKGQLYHPRIIRDELDELAGSIVALQATGRAALQAADRNEARFRSVIESTDEGIVTINQRDRILSANPAARSMLGYEDDGLSGTLFSQLLRASDCSDPEAKPLEVGLYVGQTFEVRVLHRDGHLFPGELTLSRMSVRDDVHLIAILRNIEARKKAEESEEALRRSSKMEAVGQLTGGIAHDYNNALGIIIGNLQLMERGVEKGSKVHQKLERARSAAFRSSVLTRRLLNFSRQRPEASSVVNANEVIADLDGMIGKSLTKRVEIRKDLADDLWLVNIDPGDLEDALVNLSINARDAMPDGGLLIVETRNAVLDPTGGGQPGEYVEITVSDTGVGMSHEVCQKIFDPFFSTKDVGKGTGLGLAMVMGFAQRSQGHISVFSEEGIGTTFRIFLPRSTSAKDLPETTGGEALPHGSETILIVDDEEELLLIARDLLEDLGYKALITTSGQQALRLLNDHPDIDLLFTDVVMPGDLNGYRLAEWAMNERPELKVLFASGFTGNIRAANEAERWSGPMMMKPYRIEELARRVRATLDEDVSRAPSA